jgi:hypothetical protein
MVLFSQCSQGHEFGEGRSGSRCSDGPAINGRVPGLGANRERHESRRIQFDDVGRGSSRVPESLDNLDRTVWGNADFDGFAWRDSGELLQDEPHGDGSGVAVCGPVPN